MRDLVMIAVAFAVGCFAGNFATAVMFVRLTRAARKLGVDLNGVFDLDEDIRA